MFYRLKKDVYIYYDCDLHKKGDKKETDTAIFNVPEPTSIENSKPRTLSKNNRKQWNVIKHLFPHITQI